MPTQMLFSKFTSTVVYVKRKGGVVGNNKSTTIKSGFMQQMVELLKVLISLRIIKSTTDFAWDLLASSAIN